MPTDTTNLAAAKTLVTDKLNISEPADLEDLLELSKGKTTDDPPVAHYRPWYVMANLLRHRLYPILSGEGASFPDPFKVADEYMRTQNMMDKTLGLIIPEGAEVTMSSSMRSTQLTKGY